MELKKSGKYKKHRNANRKQKKKKMVAKGGIRHITYFSSLYKICLIRETS